MKVMKLSGKKGQRVEGKGVVPCNENILQIRKCKAAKV